MLQLPMLPTQSGPLPYGMSMPGALRQLCHCQEVLASAMLPSEDLWCEMHLNNLLVHGVACKFHHIRRWYPCSSEGLMVRLLSVLAVTGSDVHRM